MTGFFGDAFEGTISRKGSEMKNKETGNNVPTKCMPWWCLVTGHRHIFQRTAIRCNSSQSNWWHARTRERRWWSDFCSTSFFLFFLPFSFPFFLLFSFSILSSIFISFHSRTNEFIEHMLHCTTFSCVDDEDMREDGQFVYPATKLRVIGFRRKVKRVSMRERRERERTCSEKYIER